MDTPTPSDAIRPDRAGGELAGDSPRMQALREAVVLLSKAAGPVWVIGEPGTGKACVARQLHALCPRPGPFIAAVANTLDPDFFEASRADGIQRAAGGTLLLRSIEELPAGSQAPLLRWLQSSRAEDGGAAAGTRLVMSSRADGIALVAQGTLRADLVQRLGSLRVDVPALRNRREDLPGLVAQLLRELAPERALQLSDAAATAAVVHAWPGNLRELRNRLTQAVLVADDGPVTPDMLGLPAPERPQSLSLREIRQAAEREAISRALRHCHGQVPTAAAMLGISRAQLYRLINRLGLDHHAAADRDVLPIA